MAGKLLSSVWMVLVLLGLAVLVSIGVVSLVVAAIVLFLVVIGLLVFHSGGTSLAHDISDHEGYQRTIQEQEEEEYGGAGGGFEGGGDEGFDGGGDDGFEGGDNTLTAGEDDGEYVVPEGSFMGDDADYGGEDDEGELEMVDELEAPEEQVKTPRKPVKLR